MSYLIKATNCCSSTKTIRLMQKLFNNRTSRSQWPCGLRCRSEAARLLRLWVRIPPRAWMSVCCECRVLSGRGLCDGLITRPEESYRLWCVVVCDLETSWMRRPWTTGGGGLSRQKTKQIIVQNKMKGAFKSVHWANWPQRPRYWFLFER